MAKSFKINFLRTLLGVFCSIASGFCSFASDNVLTVESIRADYLVPLPCVTLTLQAGCQGTINEFGDLLSYPNKARRWLMSDQIQHKVLREGKQGFIGIRSTEA